MISVCAASIIWIQFAYYAGFFFIFTFLMLIHEIGHAKGAEFFGDLTTREEGRMSFNIFKHLSKEMLFASLGCAIALMCALYMGILTPIPIFFLIPRPVRINPDNFKKKKFGPFIFGKGFAVGFTALCGPMANFCVAVMCTIILRFATGPYFYDVVMGSKFLKLGFFLLAMAIFLNILMAVMNMIPLPPLDGSKMLYFFRSDTYVEKQLEKYRASSNEDAKIIFCILLVCVVAVMLFFNSNIYAIIKAIFHHITTYNLDDILSDIIKFIS